MNRDEIANRLVVSVFVTLFFSGLSSIYIAHAVTETEQQNPSPSTSSPGTLLMIANTTSKPGNIAAATFFTAGAVLALLVTIMLGLQLGKARA
jgi:sorbitol-specific phosphotransferase system component IIBC